MTTCERVSLPVCVCVPQPRMSAAAAKQGPDVSWLYGTRLRRLPFARRAFGRRRGQDARRGPTALRAGRRGAHGDPLCDAARLAAPRPDARAGGGDPRRLRAAPRPGAPGAAARVRADAFEG